MRRLLTLACVLFFLTPGLFAQKPFTQNVRIVRYADTDRWGLVLRPGALTFDDAARKITILSDPIYNEDQYRLEVAYDNIEKADFETTTQMHGYTVGMSLYSLVPLSPAGTVVATALALRSVDVCWLYFGFNSSPSESSILFVVPKDACKEVAERATAALGEKVKVLDYQKGAKIELNDLKKVSSKQVIKVDKKNHPLPEIKPDKATVVVVCPGRLSKFAKFQFKLHANDQVVAVNTIGTYSIAYLDPGKYRLASQRENANGFDIELEAGREYYFLQNVFMRSVVPNASVLSQNSQELVTYLLHGSQFSDWKMKN
jgi:hypothetical protein